MLATISIGCATPRAALGQATEFVLKLPAHVEPYARAEIHAKTSGFVATVHVEIGDHVTQGQVLAELSVPEMDLEKLQKQAQVEQAKASVAQSEVRIESAKARVTASQSLVAAAQAAVARHEADIAFAASELQRIKELVNSRAVNAALQDEKQQQLRSAEAALTVAKADIQSAESNLSVEQANVSQTQADLVFARAQLKVATASLHYTLALMQYAQIKAPFAGQIASRSVDTGDFVSSATAARGEPLFILNRVDRFRIVFDVPESGANTIQTGQPVILVVDSVKDHEFKGQIQRSTGVLDPRTRTLRVEAELASIDRPLLPGMFGQVRVTMDGQQAAPASQAK